MVLNRSIHLFKHVDIHVVVYCSSIARILFILFRVRDNRHRRRAIRFSTSIQKLLFSNEEEEKMLLECQR